jgi:hypothetical protein
LATDKELKTLLLICEKNPDQFNSIVQKDKVELKHFCKELIQYGGTTIELAGGKFFTDDKLVKPARTVLKLFKHKRQSILINLGFKDILFSTLAPHFKDDEHIKLMSLLKGERISGRILFQDTQNELALIFKDAIDKGEISSSGKDVSNWLANWFKYTDANKTPKDCTFKGCLNVLSEE